MSASAFGSHDAEKVNATGVVLTVHASNVGAIKLYEGLGFGFRPSGVSLLGYRQSR